jgi:hypothetical protein
MWYSTNWSRKVLFKVISGPVIVTNFFKSSHISYDRNKFLVIVTRFLWSSNISCERHTFLVIVTPFLWSSNISCERHTFLAIVTSFLSSWHVSCDRQTFFVNVTHFLWSSQVSCDRDTFLTEIKRGGRYINTLNLSSDSWLRCNYDRKFGNIHKKIVYLFRLEKQIDNTNKKERD